VIKPPPDLVQIMVIRKHGDPDRLRFKTTSGWLKPLAVISDMTPAEEFIKKNYPGIPFEIVMS
jgi:hypothetical protein